MSFQDWRMKSPVSSAIGTKNTSDSASILAPIDSRPLMKATPGKVISRVWRKSARRATNSDLKRGLRRDRQTADGAEQFRDVDRLGHYAIHADRAVALDLVGHGVGGQSHDR